MCTREKSAQCQLSSLAGAVASRRAPNMPRSSTTAAQFSLGFVVAHSVHQEARAVKDRRASSTLGVPVRATRATPNRLRSCPLFWPPLAGPRDWSTEGHRDDNVAAHVFPLAGLNAARHYKPNDTPCYASTLELKGGDNCAKSVTCCSSCPSFVCEQGR